MSSADNRRGAAPGTAGARPQGQLDAQDLLVADIAHFGESFWRNEEVGEKRLTFFVTLVTAVAGGLVALATSEHGPRKADLAEIAGAAAAVLLVIGLMSFLRMVRRNLVRDDYLKTLGHVRARYRALCDDLADYRVPLFADSPARDWPRGGYAETLAVVNGLLLAASLGLSLEWPPLRAAGLGALLAATLWCAAAHARARRAGGAPSRYFRAGVGAVLIDKRGLVLVLERADVPGAWQLPQGGLEAGEAPLAAAFREVAEETGIGSTQLTLLGRHPDLLAYELPQDLQEPKTGMGQVHRWFFFAYDGPGEITLPAGGEFARASWRPFTRVLSTAADFRRPVYGRLLEFLQEPIREEAR